MLDNAQLSGTSSVNLNFATLTLNNTGTIDLTGRLNPNAPITSIGGQLVYDGRAQTASADSVGTLTVGAGLTTIQSVAGGTGTNSATLTLAGLMQSVSAGTGGTDGTLLFSSGSLGLIGNNARVVVAGGQAPAMINNIIPWAITGSNEFASYNTTYGFGAVSQTGFAGYDGIVYSTANNGVNPTQNIRGGGSIPTGGETINTLTMTLNAGFTNPSDILNLTAGGLIGGPGFSLGSGPQTDI